MAEKKNVPEIRFKGFEEKWEEKELGELVQIKDSARIPNELWAESGVRYLRSSDLENSGQDGKLFISIDAYEDYKSKTGAPERGDVLFNSGGNIGLSLLKTDNTPLYVQGGAILYARTSKSKDVDGGYLSVYFSTPRMVKYIDISSAGGTIKHFTLKPANAAPFIFPNVIEQREVSEFFQNLDKLITLHQAKYTKLVNIKKAMLEKMFPKNGAVVPEIRFKGFMGAWEVRKLSEVADIIGGGTPSTSNPEYWDGDIDWYSPTEIGKEIYANGSVKKITSLGFEKSSAKMLPPDNTVLFTSRAGIGDMAILKRPGATNQGFQSLVLKDGFNSYFIYSAGHLIKEYAVKHASGSTFLEISGKMLGNMAIHIPKTVEQEKIGNYFKHLDNLITLQQRELEKLKNIKKACLEKMFV